MADCEGDRNRPASLTHLVQLVADATAALSGVALNVQIAWTDGPF